MFVMNDSCSALCGNLFTVPFSWGTKTISPSASLSKRLSRSLSPTVATRPQAYVDARDLPAQERQAAALLQEGARVVPVVEEPEDAFGRLVVARIACLQGPLVDDELHRDVAVGNELRAAATAQQLHYAEEGAYADSAEALETYGFRQGDQVVTVASGGTDGSYCMEATGGTGDFNITQDLGRPEPGGC